MTSPKKPPKPLNIYRNRRVRIGETTWRLVWLSPAQDPGLEGCHGYCEYNKRRIVIHKECPKDEVLDVVVHEVLHAAWHVYGMEDMLKSVLIAGVDSDALQEAIVRATTSSLLPVLRAMKVIK